MLKWLVIIVIVCTGFMSILLGLGYLLKENEKETTLLKQQLEQEALVEQAKQQRKAARAKGKFSPPIKYEDPANSSEELQLASTTLNDFKQTLIDNLTCINDAQCVVQRVVFSNVKCSVAVNQIGAMGLSKLDTTQELMPSCSVAAPNQQAICQQNICTLQSNSH